MDEFMREWLSETKLTVTYDFGHKNCIAVTDGTDEGIGRTYQEALEELWFLAEARILEENREMWEEMKEDEIR